MIVYCLVQTTGRQTGHYLHQILSAVFSCIEAVDPVSMLAEIALWSIFLQLLNVALELGIAWLMLFSYQKIDEKACIFQED